MLRDECALYNLGISMAPCVVCARAVSGRLYALECDACNGWCHLRCQKGTRFILLYYFVRCRLRIRPMSWQRIMWIMSTSANIYCTALCLATKIV